MYVTFDYVINKNRYNNWQLILIPSKWKCLWMLLSNEVQMTTTKLNVNKIHEKKLHLGTYFNMLRKLKTFSIQKITFSGYYFSISRKNTTYNQHFIVPPTAIIGYWKYLKDKSSLTVNHYTKQPSKAIQNQIYKKPILVVSWVSSFFAIHCYFYRLYCR